MAYNILHLSDLHINDLSTKSGEYLSPNYYETYLDKFCKKIKSQINTLDALIITGDFVDQGKTENFAHAKKVIETLQNSLEIENRSIGVCIGNHDLLRDLDFEEKYNEARKPYTDFSSIYFDTFLDEIFEGTQRYQFKKINNDILYISMDATLGRIHKLDKPGKIKNEEIEIFYGEVKKISTSTNYKLIIIGSHYPLEYTECPDISEESDWYEKHFWKSGEHLKRRINSILTGIKVIWLSGDIHQPSFNQKDNNLYIVSGRLGTADALFEKTGNDIIKVQDISYTNRQATLIQIQDDHSAKIYVINLFNSKHGYDPTSSNWTIQDINEFSLLQNQPELISDTLDKNLKNFILHNKLFDYEKIVVDNLNHQVSLGWIMIDRLFSNPGNLNLSCNDIVAWLSKKFQSINNSKDTLFVGLDFWGAIIASNLSIMLGVENICLPSKGHVGLWSKKEHIEGATAKFTKHLTGKTNIILIADIVATGRTIKNVKDSMMQLCKNDPIFSCISLLCDMNQEKKESLSKLFKYFGTCCGSFRLPIFSKNQLPDLELMTDKFITKDEKY